MKSREVDMSENWRDVTQRPVTDGYAAKEKISHDEIFEYFPITVHELVVED